MDNEDSGKFRKLHLSGLVPSLHLSFCHLEKWKISFSHEELLRIRIEKDYVQWVQWFVEQHSHRNVLMLSHS